MSRVLHAIEKGLRVYAENSQTSFVDLLFGAGAPVGTSGETAAASIGSVYLDTTNGALYQKKFSTNSAADWILNGAAASIGKWRPERIKAVTNDTQGAGTRNLTTTPFADDDGTDLTAADFVVDDYIISDADGTPALLRVSAVSSPNVTFVAAADPLVAEDTFIAINYLPDPDGGENRALVNFNGSVIVKISDIDWQIATGINLSGSYAAASGNVAPSDTVEAAIAKLDGVNDNQDTLLGRPQGSTNLGTWTAPVDLLFSATSTVKALFQRIGDLLMQLRGVQATGITAAATVDSVPHASVKAVKWLVEAFEEATPANRQAMEVFALTDGTNVDETVYSKLKLGANFNLTIAVDISGADMRLRASSSTAGVTVTARRIEVVKSVL